MVMVNVFNIHWQGITIPKAHTVPTFVYVKENLAVNQENLVRFARICLATNQSYKVSLICLSLHSTNCLKISFCQFSESQIRVTADKILNTRHVSPFLVLTWKYFVWNRVNAHPILKSSSCLASTDRASFLFGAISFVMALLMSLSVIALNLALYTHYRENMIMWP